MAVVISNLRTRALRKIYRSIHDLSWLAAKKRAKTMAKSLPRFTLVRTLQLFPLKFPTPLIGIGSNVGAQRAPFWVFPQQMTWAKGNNEENVPFSAYHPKFSRWDLSSGIFLRKTFTLSLVFPYRRSLKPWAQNLFHRIHWSSINEQVSRTHKCSYSLKHSCTRKMSEEIGKKHKSVWNVFEHSTWLRPFSREEEGGPRMFDLPWQESRNL